MSPQNNYGGWVNPEDLLPMPQCIAQQDPSAWLETMTKCMSKGCTRHFGIICTHHQWLARLDCLRAEFTTDLVQQYFPLCSRSILAKAQLYTWINSITGRTWLVDLGDSTNVQAITPDSLAGGYLDYELIEKAPLCLRSSASFPSAESFYRITSSCSFTGLTQHTGDAARPWEYHEDSRALVALDSETVGYDLTGLRTLFGQYIDRECLCTSYTIDRVQEPCRASAQPLDLTRERLWMMATCGFRSIPQNWTSDLRTIGEAFIPVEDWTWPVSVPSTSNQLLEACTTMACEVDDTGYCRTKRAVERACFCRDMSYASCGKTCQIFEHRSSYVNWLHQVCGAVHGWHGLPDDWERLARPSPRDMIPWHWPVVRPGQPVPYSTLMLFKFLAMLGVLHVISTSPSRQNWFLGGLSIVGFELLLNWFIALIIGNAPGYEVTSRLEITLLWCAMPRLTWLPFLLVGFQPLGKVDFTAAASVLWAEAVLQALSSYHILATIAYGFEHNFYSGRLAEAEKGGFAQLMYLGALMWLIAIGLTMLQLTQTDSVLLRRWHKADWSLTSDNAGQLYWFNERWAWIDEQFACYWMGSFKGINLPVSRSQHVGYGSINIVTGRAATKPSLASSLYLTAITSIIFLWVAQLLFWAGFIGVVRSM
jgi:hypothetical protein